MILSLIPYRIFPANTGGKKSIAAFTRYLAQKKELIVVTVKSNEPSEASGYTLYNLLSDSHLRYINPAYFFTIRKLIRKHKVTYVLLEHPYYGWLGLILKWFTGVKLIVHSHNIEAQRWKSLGKWWWPILEKYEGRVHRGATLNFFIQDNDRDFAISKFRLASDKCYTITYGIAQSAIPDPKEKAAAANILRQKHGIEQAETIFLFNGALDYKPNTDAVKTIITQINPYLLKAGISYKIIICGKGLPPDMDGLKAYSNQNIIYTGFVDDIDVYFKGADAFINPVVDGGGIKTKLVEAIGWNTRTISTLSGSIGVTPEDAGEQLVLVLDNNWQTFAARMIAIASAAEATTPDQFYKKFFLG